jgi:glycosyltransferase involved in cell wall biosynthesis
LRVMFWSFAEKRVVRDCNGILFAADDEKALAEQSFLRGSVHHGYVLSYGAEDIQGDENIQKAAFLKTNPQLRGKKYVLFLGRIHAKKGIDILISAFARVAADFEDIQLVIAGPGDIGLANELKRLAAELNISHRIHWTGMVTGDEKWGAFRLAEYFVLPSHQENFGISVVEAMAASVPVLVSKRVNIWREIVAGGGGVATMDRVEDVVASLRSLLNQPPYARDMMGRHARETFQNRFNLEKNAAQLIEVIERLSLAAKSLAG